MADGTILVGIDEAGYGPLLGPLVVSASAFEVPSTDADACLWEILSDSVCRSAAKRDARIAILDSKKLYHRKEGLAKLERSVLSVIGAWRGVPPSLKPLLGLLCPEILEPLEGYPWYRAADPKLPTAADAGGIRIASARLARGMRERSVLPAGCWAEVLPEGHFNRLVSRTRNKAVVLTGLTLRLVQRVAEAHPDCTLQISIDKHGARRRYGPILLRAFEDRRLRVLEESSEHSAYALVDGRTSWRVSYTQSGESRHLPVALASLISKYLRELLMLCFNAYWTRHVPALKATAGYYQDGLRFLRDIEPHLSRLGVTRQDVMRRL